MITITEADFTEDDIVKYTTLFSKHGFKKLDTFNYKGIFLKKEPHPLWFTDGCKYFASHKFNLSTVNTRDSFYSFYLVSDKIVHNSMAQNIYLYFDKAIFKKYSSHKLLGQLGYPRINADGFVIVISIYNPEKDIPILIELVKELGFTLRKIKDIGRKRGASRL